MTVDPLVVVRAVYVAAYAAILVADLRSGRIPNAITYSLLALALVARPAGIGIVPVQSLAAAAVTALVFGALALRGWMGMGDAKLAAAIALASGPALALVTLWIAFVLGGLAGVALLLLRRAGRGSAIPFGPFLALAAIAAALGSEALLERSPFRALFG